MAPRRGPPRQLAKSGSLCSCFCRRPLWELTSPRSPLRAPLLGDTSLPFSWPGAHSEIEVFHWEQCSYASSRMLSDRSENAEHGIRVSAMLLFYPALDPADRTGNTVCSPFSCSCLGVRPGSQAPRGLPTLPRVDLMPGAG